MTKRDKNLRASRRIALFARSVGYLFLSLAALILVALYYFAFIEHTLVSDYRWWDTILILVGLIGIGIFLLLHFKGKKVME